MATLKIGIALTVRDDDDPADVMEDVRTAVSLFGVNHPEWQPVTVLELDRHDCNEDHGGCASSSRGQRVRRMPEHNTPDPWSVSRYGNIGYEIAGHESIALVNYVGFKRLEWLLLQPLTQADGLPWRGRAEEIARLEASQAQALANARLMAAAPELLAALEWYADRANYNSGRPGEPRGPMLWSHDMGKRARVVLARAKGETHG